MSDFFLRRKIYTDISTIGDLYLNQEHICSTLERTVRKQPVPSILAIPAGLYEVVLFMSPHFKCLVPQLLNVPGRSNIEIHFGNKAADSLGCILCGDYNNSTPDWISHSRNEFNKLVPLIQAEFLKGKLFLQVMGGSLNGIV